MNTDDLRAKAAELGEKAQEFLNKPEVQAAINKGKEYLDKAKDSVKDGEVQDYVEKGKEALSDAKDKLEDFVSEKTDGKGIFGFGAK